MNILEVAFMLTDRCTASCEMCCFQCTPHNSFVQDEDLMKRYIDEAAQLGSVRYIAYTGGEALLYPDLLKRMMRYGKERHGFNSSLVSNGFWAADYEKGLVLMKELKECGLSGIRLSADKYHLKYVSPQTFRNALRILLETDLLDEISVLETADGTNIRSVIETLRPEVYFAKELYLYPLCISKQTLTNQELNLGETDIPKPCAWDKCACDDITGVVLGFDGYFYNCCSPYSFDIPKMRLGKAVETTLEDLERMRRDPFLEIIRRKGVSWLAKKAKELNPEMVFKEYYSSSCELCRDVLCNRKLMEQLEPFVKEAVWKLRMETLLSGGNDHE